VSVKKKKSSKRRKAKKKTGRSIFSSWMRYPLSLFIILLFLSSFYYLFIRPYRYRWQTCSGEREYGVCMPMGYSIHGLDISRYQGRIDWSTLAQNRKTDFPLHFIFMKATEGGDHSDTSFVYNFAQASHFGFIRGAYHYYTPKTPPQKQADFFIRTAKLQPGDLPPVLDIEVKGGRSKKELQDGLIVWLRRVEAHYHVKPILYTSYKFKMNYLSDSLFNTYPYWIAHYEVDSVAYPGKWHFWQHTDRGTVPGIKGDVDLNVFNGAFSELEKLLIKADSIK
jgi:lysozyme